MNDFGGLLEKEIPRLRRYARALTRDESRADDLVQETLVRAIAKQHFWRWGSNLRAWLFTIMHHQNADLVRRSVREGRAVEIDDTVALPGTRPSGTAATDPAWRLSVRDLDRALARIREEQRQVILLIALESTYEEAATILDVPIGTIRSRLSRGRTALRMLMDRKGGRNEATNGAAITDAGSEPRRFDPEVGPNDNSDFLPAYPP
jgi:RNA polymerase sigma-70 factor, ECF subfamily